MLRSVYLKSLRDRWVAAAIAVVSLFLIAWMGLWAYAGMGDEALEFIEAMPPAYLSLLGITADAGVAGMMLGNMFNFLGPFVIAGIGVSMGAAAIAGEESDGTMNVLVSVPRSRGRLLSSKTLAVVTVIVGSGAVASLSYVAAGGLAGTPMGSLDLAAATVHLLAVCLFFGGLALALATASGNRAMASGTTVGLMVLSFLVAGLVPLFEGLEDWAKISPWYWISGTKPLANGIDWVPLLVLLAITGALFAIAWWGLARRDLGSGAVKVPIVERLRNDPRAAKALALLAGNGSTTSIASKAFTDLRPYLLVAGGGLFFQASIIGLMFQYIADSIGPIVDQMPDAILAMVGFVDFTTAEGWYYGEVMSIVAPVAVAVVAINAGASLAAEEKNRTSNVLLAMPVSRTYVATRKAIGIVTGSLIIGAALSAGTAIGNAIAGLDMDYGHIVGAGVMTVGLGVFLGAVAFVVGAASGKSSWAVGAATGITVLGWGINSFVPVNPERAEWAKISPFYYYANGNPLEVGVTWWQLGVLVGAAVLMAAIGLVAYRARDLRG